MLNVNSGMQLMQVDQEAREKDGLEETTMVAGRKTEKATRKSARRTYKKNPHPPKATSDLIPVTPGETKKRALEEDDEGLGSGTKRGRNSGDKENVISTKPMKAGLPEQSCEDK